MEPLKITLEVGYNSTMEVAHAICTYFVEDRLKDYDLAMVELNALVEYISIYIKTEQIMNSVPTKYCSLEK